MLRIARHGLDEARRIGARHSDAAFLSITMICLAFEAVCNAIGDKAVNDRKDLEQISSSSVKARIICMKSGIDDDKAASPWKTLSEREWQSETKSRIRSLTSSARPTHARRETGLASTDRPYSRLASRMNPKAAEDAILAVDAALRSWGEKRIAEDRFDILHDSRTGSAARWPASG